MKADIKKLKWNMLSAFVLQVISVICGFVLPRLILHNYNSEVNGIISSITQFLSLISFLDCGMGIVVQSALYRPLVEKNSEKVDMIISSASVFFRRLAYILLGYVICLVIVLPHIIKTSFSKQYIVLLILILSIGTFIQYYIGVVDGVILAANQKKYVSNVAQCVSVIANTVVSSILILNNFSIHFVKFTTMLIYVIRPLAVHFYISKKYAINRHVKYTEEPIPQKWNGIAQHIAAIVLDNTDVVVLSMFSAISTVSIYSVYNLVVTGIRQIILTTGNGLHSYWGSLYAEKNYEQLGKSFEFTEWMFHTIVIILYGVTAILIVPFVMIYTKGINDVNYYQPVFAILLVIAQACRCVRVPYNTLIQAVGHYKQTQKSYVVAAVVNILISVLAVKKWSLIGVAIGTICAMLYQLVWMIVYNSKNILHRPIRRIAKQLITDFIVITLGVVICMVYRNYNFTDYFDWIVIAAITVVIWTLLSIAVNYLFFRKCLKLLLNKVIKRGKV